MNNLRIPFPPTVLRSFAIIAVATLAFASTANADDHEALASNTISVGAVGVVPIGDLSDATGIGIGGQAIYQHALSPKLAITGRAGLVFHLPKNDFNFLAVPIVGGARYYLDRVDTGIFLSAEAGLSWLRASGEVLGSDVSDSEVELGLAFGGGLNLGGITVHAGLQIYSLGDLDETLSLMAGASIPVASL